MRCGLSRALQGLVALAVLAGFLALIRLQQAGCEERFQQQLRAKSEDLAAAMQHLNVAKVDFGLRLSASVCVCVCVCLPPPPPLSLSLSSSLPPSLELARA